MVIGRPKKDPDDKRGVTLTFKVTSAEHHRLLKLAKTREEEVYQSLGQHFDVTMASYLRWLVDRDAEARGFALEDPTGEPEGVELEPASAAPVGPPEDEPSVATKDAPKVKKAPKEKAPKEQDLRDELPKYRARRKIGQRALATMLGGSQSLVSTLERKARAFSPEQEAAFRALLEAEG